jgi:hypothetical protein
MRILALSVASSIWVEVIISAASGRSKPCSIVWSLLQSAILWQQYGKWNHCYTFNHSRLLLLHFVSFCIKRAWRFVSSIYMTCVHMQLRFAQPALSAGCVIRQRTNCGGFSPVPRKTSKAKIYLPFIIQYFLHIGFLLLAVPSSWAFLLSPPASKELLDFESLETWSYG